MKAPSSDQPQEREVFLAAIEIESAEERAAYLDEACRDDAQLRSRVEALLAIDVETLPPIHPLAQLHGETPETISAPDKAGPNDEDLDAPMAMPGPPKPGDPFPSGETGSDGSEPATGADNYDVGPEVARGGMGSIREARDSKLRRTVAIKIMHARAAADSGARSRFVREAEVLAQLAHPNIVPIHDILWENGAPLFYSMKMVKGHTLQGIIDDLRNEDPDTLEHYTLDRLLLIFRKVCDALAFAHAENIIHRDLKPGNIMVGEFGEVLVMDWGIAKILDESAELIDPRSINPQAGVSDTSSITATLEGSVMGTPQYMSPEQAAGEISEMDARSDIYSLGAILYAILTLRPPVEGSNVYEVLEKVQAGELTPLTDFGATRTEAKTSKKGDVLEAKKIHPLPHTETGKVPSALSSVAMKALSLKKRDRYESVMELEGDIEKWQGGFATSAEDAGLGKQLTLLIRRNKGIFTTGVTAWAIITALAVWFVLGLRASEQIAVKEREAARQSSARTSLSLAEAALRERNGPLMQTALAEVPEDLRDSTYDYLLDQSDDSIAHYQLGGGNIHSVAADPTRPGVFAIAVGGKIIIMDVRTGDRLFDFRPDFPPESGGRMIIAFSPDGQRIAAGRFNANSIVIHSAEDGAKLQSWEVLGSRQLEFSPDGQILLNVSDHLTARDPATGQVLWQTGKLGWATDRLGFQVKIAFSPDGQYVIKYDNRDKVDMLSTRDGSVVRGISELAVSAFAFQPDGELMVMGGKGRDAGLIQGIFLEREKVAFEFQTHHFDIRLLAFTPDGTRFVSVAEHDDGRQIIELWDAANAERLQTFLGGTGPIASAAVHPLSSELLTGHDGARIWSLLSTPEKWFMPNTSMGNTSIAFWGSDDEVFAASLKSSTVLQKLQEGSVGHLWKAPVRDYRLCSVSGDGRFAAIGRVTPHPLGKEPNVILLRNSGARIEPIDGIDVPVHPDLLRLNSTGDRLAMIQRSGVGAQVYPTNMSQPAVSLDGQDVKAFHDIGWLSGDRKIIGLVTAKAERGNEHSEEQIVVWDASTGKILQTTTNRTPMDALAVAPDGRRFAEAGADKMVRIRDVETLAVQQEFRAHDGPITALAWHPTRPIVASASLDLSVRIWDLETGRRMEDFRGMGIAPNSLAFSPSGLRFGCAGSGGPTRIWDPPSLQETSAVK